MSYVGLNKILIAGILALVVTDGLKAEDQMASSAKPNRNVAPHVNQLLDSRNSLSPSDIPTLLSELDHPEKLLDSPAGTSVLEEILSRLEPYAPPELAAKLSPMTRHENSQIRRLAALGLGKLATDNCLAPLAITLQDDDDYVRSYAVMGLADAFSQHRGSKNFWKDMFDTLASLLERPSKAGRREMPLLLQINRDKASQLLLQDKLLYPDNADLYHVLRALNEADVPVPVEKTRALLKALRPEWEYRTNSIAYAAALVALAKQKAPEAEAMIREAMPSKNDTLCEGGAKALEVLNDIPETEKLLALPLEQLNPTQRTIVMAYWVDAEVANGAFAQYFDNSSGDEAHASLGALQSIQDLESAHILQQAMALFGPSGPSPIREKRWEQLEKMSERDGEVMDTLSDQFCKKGSRRRCLIAEYAVKHRAEMLGLQKK